MRCPLQEIFGKSVRYALDELAVTYMSSNCSFASTGPCSVADGAIPHEFSRRPDGAHPANRRARQASPSADATGRKPEASPALSPASAPLNFKVDADFRRRFRQRAAEADLKLNELLREALEAWEQRRGLA